MTRVRVEPDLSPEVSDAIADGRPVLALESTIISHGMPYPRNVETALAACRAARDAGVVPAIAAIIDGRICAGLNTDQIDLLGRRNDVAKISRRDVAFAASNALTGATTVSATMLIAHGAGIAVFATGGIGGVHRAAAGSGASQFDVSADLIEFSRTPVAVVSAGAKAILDLAATLEVLETQGVPVVGYRTDEFPAFYSRSSGLAVPMRVDTPEEAAALIRIQRSLGLEQGILFANPVPEAYEISGGIIEGYLETVLAESESKGIRGREITPFLLSRIVELSGGLSLETNVALYMNNVRLGAAIAASLCGVRSDG